MGYTTQFDGRFNLSKHLTTEQSNYLHTFSGTRRMRRNPDMLMEQFAGLHGLDGKYGIDGEFFCLDDGQCGQTRTPDIINYNDQPSTQPSLWCQWIPTTDNMGIEWDGSEKFYCYVDWLKYIIDNFLKPWGIEMSGCVEFEGEDEMDAGFIKVFDNVVTVENFY
jgi:hypothetical protein